MTADEQGALDKMLKDCTTYVIHGGSKEFCTENPGLFQGWVGLENQ